MEKSQIPSQRQIPNGWRRSKCRDVRRGFALIVVIGTLSLVTVLTLGLLSNAATELKGADSFDRATSARSMADVAVNLVVTQIRNGTRSQSDAGGGSAEPQVWASQPGLIRTYNAAGTPDEIYKLYSDAAMTVAATGFISDLSVLPDDWNEGVNQALYADINRPLLNSKNELSYPVVDPTIAIGGVRDSIEGFDIVDAPGYDSSEAPSGANNPAPMPVRWLYQLQDGTLVAPTLTGGKVKVPGATELNPIVGRIAFWADDESAKININTASEGTFWDVPRTYSLEDVGKFSGSFSHTPTIEVPGYSVSQPARREFQRYPGHPATVCLSAVLGAIMPVPEYVGRGTAAADAAKFEAYYKMAPRTHTGGSEAGTKVSKLPIELDSERLFASTEEILFQQELARGAIRQPQPLLNESVLSRRKFFLTSASNAPETTLFNTPRISMWPVHLEPDKRTAYDSPDRVLFDDFGKPLPLHPQKCPERHRGSLAEKPDALPLPPGADFTQCPRLRRKFSHQIRCRPDRCHRTRPDPHLHLRLHPLHQSPGSQHRGDAVHPPIHRPRDFRFCRGCRAD